MNRISILFARLGLVACITLVLLTCNLIFSSPVAAQTFSRPVFVQNVTTNSVELRWKTANNASVTVKYGTTASYGQQVTSDSVNGGTQNHASITGLSPNTKYFYQLVAGSTNLTPAGDQNYYFKTAPTSCTSSSPCTFIVIGDSGDASTTQKNIAAQIANKNPDMLFIVGDVVYNYSSDPEYNDARLFDIYANTIRHTALYSMCGNHDSSNCSVLVNDHSLPQNGNASGVSTFSFDYGDIHFNASNSNAAHALTSPQVVWMKNDLQSSNKPFKIAMWHHNYWSAGSHSTESGYEPLVRTANDAGADVAFWGHSHVYERWNKSSTYPNIQLFTIGNGGNSGGSSCSNTSPGPGCNQKSSSGDSAGGMIYGTVAGNTMTLQYITQSGSTTGFAPLVLTSDGTGPTNPPGTSTPVPTNTPTRPPNQTPTTPPVGSCIQGTTNWVSKEIVNQTGRFTARMSVRPQQNNEDAAFGFSFSNASSYSDLAVSSRFYTNGQIETINGGGYAAATSVPYQSGGTYQFRYEIDIPNHVYDLFITSPDGQERQLASNYAFRSTQSSITEFQYFTVRSATSTDLIEVCNLQVGEGGPEPTTPPGGSNADGNGDGKVDGVDWVVWMNHYGQNVSGRSNGDYYADGKVDGVDYVVWFQSYGQTVSTPIPTQPATPTQPSGQTATVTPTRVNTSTPTPTIPGNTTTVPPTLPPIGQQKGIWISQEELNSKPTSGAAWDRLVSAANGSWGSPCLHDNNCTHDVNTLAGALVAARTGDNAMRSKTISALVATQNSTSFSRVLEMSRGFQTYIIAADVIGYRTPQFESWVRNLVEKSLSGHSGGGNLRETAMFSANNWGGHARASLAAAAVYLNDSNYLNTVATAHKAFIGVSAPGNQMTYTSTNWHADSNKAGINRKGATRGSINISGVLPEDWRRAEEYKWPPSVSGYMWEGMQGHIVATIILHRAGLVPLASGDNALMRAMDILYHKGEAASNPSWTNPASGDDTWIPWVANFYFNEARYPTATASPGKNMGWTDWTHAR